MLLYTLLQIAQKNAQPTVSIWAIVAAIAAIISAFSAFKSRGYARRSYALAQKNYNDKQANFSLHLIDSYRFSDKKTTSRFLLFHTTILNKSDSKNSFRAELEIRYIREDDSTVSVIVSHDETLKNRISKNEISIFPNDIRIEERGMQSKWLVFEQHLNPFKQYRIEKYIIKVIDIQGNKESAESSFIKESYNEEGNSKG